MMTTDYEWIERGLQAVHASNRAQSSLDQLAVDLGLSLSACDRLVRRWAGVAPQTFLEILTGQQHFRQFDRGRLDDKDSLYFSRSVERRDAPVHTVDLGSSNQAQDGLGLEIRYGEHDSPFGRMFLAVTKMGICRLSFMDQAGYGDILASLKQTWLGSVVQEDKQTTAPIAAALFAQDDTREQCFDAVLRGTEFQVKVWKALLKIPMGGVCAYRQVARAIDRPNASRAVGSAVAANPIAYLVPCHRVIRSSGATGEYRWGKPRKRAMLVWEACRVSTDWVSGNARVA